MRRISLRTGNTDLILRECKAYGCTEDQTAYILAKAYHETNATMRPVKEAYWLSEKWRRTNLFYHPWYGRGYVQLTWEKNYNYAAKRLKIPFGKDPDLALNPIHAAKILIRGSMEGWFTKHKLNEFVLSTGAIDFIGARKVINGIDEAEHIAKIAKTYRKLLNTNPANSIKSRERTRGSGKTLIIIISAITVIVFSLYFAFG